MSTLMHDLLGFIWGITLVVGFVIGALVWIGMAIWDSIRGLYRRISGEDIGPRGDDLFRS